MIHMYLALEDTSRLQYIVFLCLKGESNEIFELQFFIIRTEPAWATDQWPMG